MKTVIFVAATVMMFLHYGCQQTDPLQQVKVRLKPAVDAYISAWNTGAVDTLDAFCDRAVVRYEWTIPTTGLDSLKKLITVTRFILSDLKLTVDEEAYAGHQAAIRYTVTGKNTGAGVFPPTGKSVTISGMSMFRFAGNKIVEVRAGLDAFTFFQQLGFKFVPPAK